MGILNGANDNPKGVLPQDTSRNTHFADAPTNKNKSRKGKTTVGWTGDGSELPRDYKIVVSSTALNVSVVAALQEKTSFKIGSVWDTFVPIGGALEATNASTQLAAGTTVLSKFSSRRIWKGTSPLELQLRFNFQSINDTYSNVIAPCKALMQMVSPGTMDVSVGKTTVPLLTPPGPSPFALSENKKLSGDGKSGSPTLKGLDAGDIISINIGRHFFFPKVILKNVLPSFDNKMDVNGWPISAEVEIIFETYEVITKSDLDHIFHDGVDHGNTLGG